MASLTGNAHAVQTMLANRVPQAWLAPALAAAVLNGRNEIVRLLLSSGADPNESRLASAAHEGRMETLSLLLEAGADPNRPMVFGQNQKGETLYGETPLMAAARNDGRIRHEASKPDPEKVLRFLIERGADVEGCDAQGVTALMQAAIFDSVIGVRTLVKCNASVNRADRKGRTALHFACARANVGATSELLAAGADPNLASHTGFTPLHCAAGSDLKSFVAYLQRHFDGCGFDDSAAEKKLVELQRRSAEIVRLLLSHGAAREVQNSDALTPVQIAQGLGYERIVKSFQPGNEHDSRPES
jgi:ankyrin repeat protein